MVAVLESFVFRHRIAILVVLAVVTLVTGYFASQLRMDAGFTKQLPLDHEYIKTFFEYQDRLFGSNRVIVVVRAKQGDIWNQPFLAKLQEVTDALFFLPGVDRRTVTSIWTPNTRYFEITEEGLIADDVIPSHVLPGTMGPDEVALVRDNVIKGGYVGRLVAKDYSAAMITAELLEVDPRTEERLDPLDLAARLETEIREKFASEEFDVHILGFVTLMGQIAAGAASVVRFFALAFALTAGAVYLYSRSWVLTLLPLLCSLTSVIWQFGVIHLLGFGLDPLAVLVPFLVFAIGVSHGVQQINLISKQVCAGADSLTAARRSFSGLLVSGTGALVTDLIGFGTLVIMPIQMIQELGITALIGVAFQIITILVMLPVLASFFRFDAAYVARVTRSREAGERLIRGLGRIAEPRYAVRAVVVFAVVYGLAIWQSQGRHVGDLQPGAPELRPSSRYNQDAMTIVSKFSLGLDVLTVIVETPEESCIDYRVMRYLDEFDWHLRNVPGVLSVASLPSVSKQVNAGGFEGNLKWKTLPRNRYLLVRAAGHIPEETGLLNAECTLMPLYVFTADHKAETIKRVIAAVEAFRDTHPMEGVRIRLASGNVGLQAAVNEELERSEAPMMIYVYLAIVALVFMTYRDWRATVCCSVPLSMATLLGYWFMKEIEIGLKVATMPVMVLAVGLGVDYAFYIYNRLQVHLSEGLDITTAYKQTLLETGNAVIFTAATLAIGVSTWSFSALKFQADMGLLLTFMFVINMIMAVTMLPALAVVIDLLLPRRGKGRGPSLRALAALAALLTLAWPVRGLAEESPEYAIPSRLATQSLLLDVARAGERLVAVGEWGHVVLSDDGGKTWRQARSVPTRMTLTEVTFVDPGRGWAVGHDAVVLHTSDGGETWELQYSDPEDEATLLSVWFENADHGIAVGSFGLAIETRDGGRSWKPRTLVEDEDPPHLNHLFAGPGGTLFVAAEFAWVYRSQDAGRSWRRFHPPYEGSLWGGMSLGGSGVLVFGMRGHAFRSEDLGESWQAVDTGTDQSLQDATRLAGGAIVVVGLGGVVATSTDAGRTFAAAIKADRRGIAAVAEGVDGALLLFGEAGVETRPAP